MKHSSSWYASIRTKLGLRPNAETKSDERSDEKNTLDALAEYSAYDPRQTSQVSNPKAEGEDRQPTSRLPPVSGENEAGHPAVCGNKSDDQSSQANKNTERWIMLFTAALAGTAIVTNFQTCSALRDSRTTFEESQRPYVSIGKRDGTIGNFSELANANGNVAVVLYFHNGGNLPASRFNPRLFAPTGPTPETQLHMARLTNSQTTLYINGLKEIARDSDDTESFPDWISAADVVAAKAGKKIIPVNGFFEYCDEFGNYTCREFSISFDGSTDEFNLLQSNECRYEYPVVIPTLPAALEYVPPCPSSDEQKEEQAAVKQYIEDDRPSPIPAWHAPIASATPK